MKCYQGDYCSGKFVVLVGSANENSLDLLHSTREGLRPRYPNIPKPTSIGVARPTILTLGPMNEALHVACEIVAALDSQSDLQLLDNPRRWLVHTLLSTSYENALVESSRLAFLLFVDIVIYPLPSCTGVKARLCKSLISKLKYVNSWPCELGLAWIVMIGGMCSKGSEREESLFAEYFVKHCIHRFEDWEILSSTMQDCLWHPVCHGIGYGFWQTCCLKKAYL
jgi:hypothetical protein